LKAPPPLLFPFGEYWWFYAGFTVFVILLLALDLGVFHRKAHTVSLREAAGWSAFWVALSLLFNAGFYVYMLHRFPQDPRLAAGAALEFLAGYVVEKALSVDNLFVFVVVLGYFRVPSRYQHRVLFFGILGALVFRGAFIAAGAMLLSYEIVALLFGAFLIVTGVRMMLGGGDPSPPRDNAVIRLFRRWVPVTAELHDAHFFVRTGGTLQATPLFVTLLFVEMTDVMFAVDSVPAIFALTREPLIVFTSNIFAILGLRAMYFLLAGALDRFHLLKYGLGVVLVFVGLKMAWLNDLYQGHFPIGISLAIITGVIAASIVLSLFFPPPRPEPEPAAGPETLEEPR
jgi:TerC family integral membrane protein